VLSHAIPPSITVYYPADDGKQNLVGEGTLLTILGRAQQGTYSLSKIQAIEGESVLQEWPISSSSDFRIDLEKFGSAGRKTLKLRAVDSQGLFGETQLPIINDNNQLDSAARDFLRRYNIGGREGTWRFGNLETGPYAKPVRVDIREVAEWQNLIQQACDFWTKYTGIRFEISTGEPQALDVYIANHTNQDPGIVAQTFLYGILEKSADIELYKGWLGENETEKVITIAHELGHALVTEMHTEPAMYDIMSNMWPLPLLWWPYEQKATKILYSLPPGSKV